MKRKCIMFGVALLVGVLAFGDTYTDEDGLVWTYSVSSGKATLSGVSRTDAMELTGVLTVPSKVTNDVSSAESTVGSIAVNAFQGLAIIGLNLPNTLTTISEGAFANCTALETLTIPDSVTTLGAVSYNYIRGAFSGCTALRRVTLGSGLTTISDGRFDAVSSGTDGNAYSGVFGNCINLEEVTFGPNLLHIGRHAFSECSALKELTLPDSVRTIGLNAFYHNSALSSVSLGTELTSIGDCAFCNCPELQMATFRECHTPRLTIGVNAFADAVKLVNLTLSDSIVKISEGAFANCTALETLVIPDSVTTLGAVAYNFIRGAFSGCTALRSVNLGSGLTTISDGRSDAVSSGTDGHAYSGVFGNCINLEEVAFGPNLLHIGRHAFSECSALTSLDFPDSLQTVGVNGFYNNIRLTRVSFGANLQLIDECAFMGCVSLNSLTFSAATTPLLTIKSKAFKNCVQLASLMLSNAMPTIETGAFDGCTMLRRITIPSLMSTIKSGVFSSMSNLREVTFLGLPPENLENAGLAADVKLRYLTEYAEDWESAISTCGFTNAEGVDSAEIASVIIGDTRYELSATPSDRSIASITVDGSRAIDSFVLTDGKVYDSVLRIVNTANIPVTLTLPSGYAYETFEGSDPLTIPANSRNILTITRTAANTFLVSREKLRVLE